MQENPFLWWGWGYWTCGKLKSENDLKSNDIFLYDIFFKMMQQSTRLQEIGYVEDLKKNVRKSESTGHINIQL